VWVCVWCTPRGRQPKSQLLGPAELVTLQLLQNNYSHNGNGTLVSGPAHTSQVQAKQGLLLEMVQVDLTQLDSLRQAA
jgi:hypothetical protein